jgi:hypothetical protein
LCEWREVKEDLGGFFAPKVLQELSPGVSTPISEAVIFGAEGARDYSLGWSEDVLCVSNCFFIKVIHRDIGSEEG